MNPVTQHSLERGNTRPPDGVILLEMKYCELCGRPFSRPFAATEPYEAACVESYGRVERGWIRIDKGKRLCDGCTYRPAFTELRAEQLITAQEEYKEQFAGIKSSTHQLPHYDNSLTKAPRKQRKLGVKRSVLLARAGATRELIQQAFRERGRLTTEDLQALIEGCFALPQVHIRIKSLGFKLRAVDWVRPERITRGPGMAVYVLPGFSPETLQ